MQSLKILTCAVALAFSAAATIVPAQAGNPGFSLDAKGGNKPTNGGGGGGGGGGGSSSPTYYSWMSPDITVAWNGGYLGQNTTMYFVDDFSSSTRIFGNLGTGLKPKRHGDWTTTEASMLAPSASIIKDEFTTEQPIALAPGFNTVNASYGFVDVGANYTANWASAYPQEQSIMDAAANDLAVVSKAAGNDSVAVGTTLSDGTLDYLDVGLIGKPAAIFAGALDFNGTDSNPAPLSYYSNYAGSDPTVQGQFVVVGVDYSTTGLAGTSFAAPIITAYSSILASKFTTATPNQIAAQIEGTASGHLLVNPYGDLVKVGDGSTAAMAAVYGNGQASISRALAPQAIQ